MHTLDLLVQHYFSTNRTETLTQSFYLLTILFDFTTYFIFFSFCVTGLIYLVRNIRYAVFFIVTIFSTAVVVYILKITFNVSRPSDALFVEFGKSFPSYHATLATVFFILLMYIFDDFWDGLYKKIFNFFCVVLIFLISLSRVYLGVHWFSDVFFGIILGCVISYLSISVFKRVIIA